MKNIFLFFSIFITLGVYTPKVLSGEKSLSSESLSSSSNQATNNQSSVGSVTQSPVGGINSNYQINNSQATDYGFAPGVVCRGPNISIGGYGSGFSSDFYRSNASSSNYGAVAVLTIPIGSSISESCKYLAKEIVKQRQLDTSLNMIKQCAFLKKDGIQLDLEIFPEFKKCEGVSIIGNQNISNLKERPKSVFNGQDKNVQTVIPVR